MAIHDRIKDVQRLFSVDGRPASLARLAELAGHERQTLTQIVAKSRRGTESGFGVLSEYADKWGVSFEWLTKGRGEMKPRPRDPLELAIESEPWDEAAIIGVRAIAETGKQCSVAEWARALRALHEAINTPPPAAAPRTRAKR